MDIESLNPYINYEKLSADEFDLAIKTLNTTELNKLFNKLSNELENADTVYLLLNEMKQTQVKEENVESVQPPNVTDMPIKTEETVTMEESKPIKFDKIEPIDISNGLISMEHARKILDHEFEKRKLEIREQINESLFNLYKKKKDSISFRANFIPTLNSDFSQNLGMEEVVEQLRTTVAIEMDNNDTSNSTVINRNISNGTSTVSNGRYLPHHCSQCNTDSTVEWKTVTHHCQTLIYCSECYKMYRLGKFQKEFKEVYANILSKFDEKEISLKRDYNEMLTDAHKMQQFRADHSARLQLRQHQLRSQSKVQIQSNKPQTISNSTINNTPAITPRPVNNVQIQLPVNTLASLPNTQFTASPQVVASPQIQDQQTSPAFEMNSNQILYLQLFQGLLNASRNQNTQEVLSMQQVQRIMQNYPMLMTNIVDLMQRQQQATNQDPTTLGLSPQVMTLITLILNMFQNQHAT